MHTDLENLANLELSGYFEIPKKVREFCTLEWHSKRRGRGRGKTRGRSRKWEDEKGEENSVP